MSSPPATQALGLAPAQPCRSPVRRQAGAAELLDELMSALLRPIPWEGADASALKMAAWEFRGLLPRGPLKCQSPPFPGRPFGIAKVSVDRVWVPEPSSCPPPPLRPPTPDLQGFPLAMGILQLTSPQNWTEPVLRPPLRQLAPHNKKSSSFQESRLSA